MRIFLKIALCLLIIIALYSFIDFLLYKRFSNALEKANQIPSLALEKQYKDVSLKNKYKAVLVANSLENLNYSEYFKFSAERLGWEALILDQQTLGNENEILAFNPDFIIFNYNSNPDISPRILAHPCKKYILSFESLKTLRDNNYISKISPYKAKHNLAKFIQISDGILTSSTELDIFRKIFANLNKPFNGLRLLPLAPRMDNEPAEPKNLHLNVSKYDNLAIMLDKKLPTKIYGPYNSNLKHYAGYTELGIKNINTIRKDGIFLNLNGLSLELFAAASANVIIIAEKDPFILENFANNILYYDAKKSDKAIYKQIKTHMEWIEKNPQKAKEMASRAHNIFNEKFALEKDLVRIAKMHEYIASQNKAQNKDTAKSLPIKATKKTTRKGQK